MGLIATGILWIFLSLAAVTVGVDVGGTALAWYARRDRRAPAGVAELIDRYVSPIWETSNVFIVAIDVVLAGFFPGAVPFFGTTLIVPLALALIAMVARAIAYIVSHYADRGVQAARTIYAASGVMTPLLLVPFLAAGDVGISAHSSLALLVQPLTLALMLVALTSVGSLGAALLTWFAQRAGDPGAARYLRGWAVRLAPCTVLASLLLGLAVHVTARAHAAGIGHLGLVLFLAAVLFGAHLWLLTAGRRPGLGFLALAGSVFCSFAAWQFGEWPYLARPNVTVSATVVNAAMFQALLLTLTLGLLILIPALAALYALFAFGRGETPAHSAH